MNTNQIICFLNLAETLNFSETATNLHLTQPAVTKIIQQLEGELMIRLFERTRCGVHLTKAGEIFYEDMKSVMIKVNMSVERAKEQSERDNKVLSIGYTGTAFEVRYMPKVLKSLGELYPNYTIVLSNSNLNKEKDDLLNSKFDLIFTSGDNLTNDSDFEFMKIIDGQFVCVLPKDHQLAEKENITIQDLVSENLIFFNTNQAPPDQEEIQTLLKRKLPTANYLYGDTISIVHTMIKGGMGVSVLPDFVTDKHDSELAIIPLDVTYQLSYGIVMIARNKFEKQDIFKVIKNIMIGG